MNGLHRSLMAVAVLVAGVSMGCQENKDAVAKGTAHEHHAALAMAADGTGMAGAKDAIAVLHATEGNKVAGWVRFTDAGDGVRVTAEISGLAPNSKHGFHIHEFGDCSDMAKATSAGGHYDPMGTKTHGMPSVESGKRHGGDMGNLQADESGKAKLELTLEGVTVSGKNAILGRGVIVHEKEDNGGQPVGNAGGRLACGVIGVAKGK